MKEKTLQLEINGKTYAVTIKEFNAYEAVVNLNDKTYRVGLKDLGLEQVADLTQKIASPESSTHIIPTTIPHESGPILHKPKTITHASAVVAPLPGLIQRISVNIGDLVKIGQQVIIMEAMKMENEIAAPRDGRIKSIRVRVGDSVNEGDILVELE